MADLLNPVRPESPYDTQFPPEMVQDAASLRRRRALVDLLLTRSMTPPPTPSSGGITIPISPLASLSNLASGGVAALAQRGLDRGEQDLAAKYSGGLSDARGQVSDLIKSGDYGGASQVAGRWPALKAVSDKLMERQFPQYAIHPTYGPGGTEQPAAVNMNAPGTPPIPIGGMKTPPLHPIETAGPTGEPQTSFVNLQDPTLAALPKPVKMAFENTGGEITPANPYTQTEPLKKTLDPNRVPTPEDLEANAQLIAAYKMRPIEGYGQRAPGGAAIMRRVSEINPGYDAKIYNTGKVAETAFASGKQGNTIRSFNVALNHLDTLSKVADNLGNTSFRPGNQLYNYTSEQLGQPAPTEFSAVKKIVGDEIVKAIIGSGGGVTDREEAATTISRANSPEQLKGVIKQYKTLMSGQLGGLRQQYIASTGKQDFDKFLTQEGLTAAGRPNRRASDQAGGTIDFNDLPK